jgi:SAM-dependent MidA family methyltransferase
VNLNNYISELIEANQGWVSFASFMHEALYHPQLGYYASGLQKFGPGGDFITAPELSRFFGMTVGRQVKQVLDVVEGNVLELGAGSGKLCRDILSSLESQGRLPDRYLILEPSESLARRQRELLSELSPRLFERIHWLRELPEQFEGVIIANEVFDALPVHILKFDNGETFERGVCRSSEGFSWSDRKLSKEMEALAPEPPSANSYITEFCPAAFGLMNDLASVLSSGAMLIFDYGYEADSYYHPDRVSGTLMCYHRHQADTFPLLEPGEKDITAHVNFSLLAHAATDAGLDLIGYCNQAQFLVNAGITTLLEEIDPSDSAQYYPAVSAVQKLLSSDAMGSVFKAMCVSRQVDLTMIGFTDGDRRYRL